jgi:predicted dehydrogenase/threonine dehydrogenase-like Zn-dependent dehydrogenase
LKQVLQHVRSGETTVVDVPVPLSEPGKVLVQVGASLVSAGTERMVVDFAHKNLLQKARSRPDLVRQTMDKAKRDGVLTTFDAVQNRLDRPMTLGYSCAGRVIEVGAGVTELEVGDAVACAGTGAAHAEIASVGRNLVAHLPEGVGIESGAFGTLGAIALQGMRLAEIQLGETVAVIGLGLLGQLTVQMLRAAGCVVAGMDLQQGRADLGRASGAHAVATDSAAFVQLCLELSAGRGADSVLITADTRSNDPVELAGTIARDRAVVVAVGAVGMNIPRPVYYEKELDFRISRSYGPGRYDPEYEEEGRDYPAGYVRWTENRNMQAFLQLLADGTVNVQPLITHRFPIERGAEAYDLITGSTDEPFLGVLITYPSDTPIQRRVELRPDSASTESTSITASVETVRVGLLGAGNFATATLLPAMQKLPGLELVGVSTATGSSARAAADKFGFRFAATDEREILEDPAINTVVVATRHHLHARQAIAALLAGKDVFVEKPLAMDATQLAAVLQAQRDSGRRLMVGFNRRFAPMVTELRRSLQGRQGPLIITCRVNAGSLPPDHWTQNPTVGGGRIIGEACHFIDLLQFLTGSPPTQVSTVAARSADGPIADQVVITVAFGDGSIGTIVYTAGGDTAFGKERIEVLGDGRIAVLDDYRVLEIVRNGRRKRRHERLRPDKGHRGEWEAFISASRSGAGDPIPLNEIAISHLATFAAVESVQRGEPVEVNLTEFRRTMKP